MSGREFKFCGICKRPLEIESDELSMDCGGDCWGCVGEIEADGGYIPSMLSVIDEWHRGLRPNWTLPKPNEVCQMCGDRIGVDAGGLCQRKECQPGPPKPSAQPHVAAGPVWTMKLRDAVMELLDAARPEPGVPYMPSKAFAKLTSIHELMDEVVELPEPTEYKAVKMNNGLIGMVDLGLFLEREEALQLAAALIRAATSSAPSA